MSVTNVNTHREKVNIVAPTSTRTDVPEVTFRALIVIIRNDVFSPSDSMLSIIMFITVACYATLYM